MPSWMTKIPTNYGTPSAGTLKCDEWRTLATVHIPLALVSLWGEGTQHPSETVATTLRSVLDHTMDLFSSIRLACARTMTKTRAAAYRTYLASYVSRLGALHPDEHARPNHHAAFHIYDFLFLFGPVRSWWCFPFERLIGILQRLPSNHKPGKCTLYTKSFTC